MERERVDAGALRQAEPDDGGPVRGQLQAQRERGQAAGRLRRPAPLPARRSPPAPPSGSRQCPHPQCSHRLGPHRLGPHRLGPHRLGPHRLGPHGFAHVDWARIDWAGVHGDVRAQLPGVGEAGLRLVGHEHAAGPGPLEQEREEGARGPLPDDRGILADEVERMASQGVDDRAQLLGHEQVAEWRRVRQRDAGRAGQRLILGHAPPVREMRDGQHAVPRREARTAGLHHLAHALVPGVADDPGLGRRAGEHAVQVGPADGCIDGPQQDLTVRSRRQRRLLADHTIPKPTQRAAFINNTPVATMLPAACTF